MGTRRSRGCGFNVTRSHPHRQRWWTTRSKIRSRVERQFRRPTSYGKFKKNRFLVDGLDFVNKCAYFDYQREKIFFRNGKPKKTRTKIQSKVSKIHINKLIEIPLPMACYKCGSSKIFKRDKLNKIIFSVKFDKFGVKRWVVKYSTSRVSCDACQYKFRPCAFTKIRGKYGYELYAYMTYQHIALR